MLQNHAADTELEAEIRARVVNLTPHPIRLLARGPDGSVLLIATLDPADVPARVEMAPGEPLGVLEWVPVEMRACPTPGKVTGLPERLSVYEMVGMATHIETRPLTPIRHYVVSSIVAQALRGKGRDDVYTVGTGPNDVERRDGQVWGTYALEQAPQ